MARGLAVGMLMLCICGAAMAEPDVSSEDPFVMFWNNFFKQPFPHRGDGTSWGDMLESMRLDGYIRARYNTSDIGFIQRIFGPSVTGQIPDPDLGAVNSNWEDWLSYKVILGANFSLTHDISFRTSIINMNVLGQDNRFERFDPDAGTPFIDSPQVANPEVQLYEGYGEWKNFFMPGITALVGRTELVYGNEWILSDNEFYGGLTWDTIKLSMNTTDQLSVDFFLAEINHMYSPRGPAQPQIAGLYSSYRADMGLGEKKNTLIDLYFLYTTDDFRADEIGVTTDFANDKRYTVGARVAGWFMPEIDYDLQAAYQFGHSAEPPPSTDRSATVSAYAASAEIGLNWEQVQWSPRISGSVSYASGDSDLDDGDADAYNPLYRNIHGMNGLADVFHFTNLVDWAAQISFKPYGMSTLGIEGHIFRSAERISPPTSKELGKELDFFFTADVTSNLNMRMAYAIFSEGDAFNDVTGERPHNNRFYIHMVYKF